MTDKEMAVNWIRSQGWSEESLPSDEFEQMFQAYLAGLETGRPEWHDPRKNPDDLPNCNHGHTVFNQDLDRVIIRNGRFEFPDGCPAHVIAWCEIPKFEEVEGA